MVLIELMVQWMTRMDSRAVAGRVTVWMVEWKTRFDGSVVEWMAEH